MHTRHRRDVAADQSQPSSVPASPAAESDRYIPLRGLPWAAARAFCDAASPLASHSLSCYGETRTESLATLSTSGHCCYLWSPSESPALQTSPGEGTQQRDPPPSRDLILHPLLVYPNKISLEAYLSMGESQINRKGVVRGGDGPSPNFASPVCTPYEYSQRISHTDIINSMLIDAWNA